MRFSSSHLAHLAGSPEMVGELRHRDRGERVSQCESEPRHQAYRRICDRQIALWGDMRGISLVALLSMP
jgi:hypothetical protein